MPRKISQEKKVAIKTTKKEMKKDEPIVEKIDVEFENKKENPYLIPLSIVAAGILIAISIFYKDQLPSNQPGQPNVDVVKSLGLKTKEFESCLASDAPLEKIKADMADAEKAGGQGTPYSIVIAPSGKRFVIPGAFPFEDVKQVIEQALQDKDEPTKEEREDPIYKMADVSDKDHLLGNPEAPVKIVEFSDFECPYCQAFHDTMKQVMSEYGINGQVAWVYRHLPLTSIHRYALDWAKESECVNTVGGAQKFWEYVDARFANQ